MLNKGYLLNVVYLIIIISFFFRIKGFIVMFHQDAGWLEFYRRRIFFI